MILTHISVLFLIQTEFVYLENVVAKLSLFTEPVEIEKLWFKKKLSSDSAEINNRIVRHFGFLEIARTRESTRTIGKQ